MTREQVTPAQVRAARGLVNWTVRDLAKAAGIHRNTVTSFEVGRYAGRPETVAAMRKALEKAGIEFITGRKLGVVLYPPQVGRRRLRSEPQPVEDKGKRSRFAALMSPCG